MTDLHVEETASITERINGLFELIVHVEGYLHTSCDVSTTLGGYFVEMRRDYAVITPLYVRYKMQYTIILILMETMYIDISTGKLYISGKVCSISLNCK